jgi:hypothetical protein
VPTVQTETQVNRHAIKKLPAREKSYSPVTVDLNGRVAIRAKGEEGPATELVLTNSRCEGDPLRISTNRTFLERALRFGFRELHLTARDAPACCRDDRRAYVWALLEPEETTPADADTLRVESPSADPAPTNSNQQPRRKRPQTMTTSTRTSRNGKRSNGKPNTNRDNGENSDVDLLDQAEQLKRSLREALSAANTLTTGLKRQRQKSKRLRSAVASLKELEAIDA